MKKFSFFVIMGLWISICNATIINVPSDQPTIQAGIDASVDGDTVLIAPGTYTGEGNYNISFNGKNITVMSNGDPESTIIDCQGNGFGFIIVNGEINAVLKGITIKNGAGDYTGGGIYIDGVTVSVDNCILENNSTGHQGGGIGCVNANANINNCLFYHNYAEYGSAMYVNSSEVIIENCSMYDNESLVTDACFKNDYCTPMINNCIISYNLGRAVTGTPELNCSDIFGNEGGDWTDQIVSQYGIDGNISLDPLFCDTANLNFSLSAFSPCNSVYSSCGYIGARDVGCSPLPPNAIMISYSDNLGDNIINSLTPDISWIYFDTASTTQAAYEIEVGTDDYWNIAEMWSTGPVSSLDSVVTYDGSPLSNNTTYFIRIRLSNGTNWGAWSESSFKTHSSFILGVPSDFANIQEAIDSALIGDTILVASGTYTGDGFRDISYNGKDVVVMSENGPDVTILDCQGSSAEPHRGFVFENEETSAARLVGFSIINGYSPYMPYHQHYDGGAILIYSSEPIIENCIFKNNEGGHHGGAVVVHFGNPTFIDCLFIENTAKYGGAAQLTGMGGTFQHCTFYKNTAYNWGSAIQSDASDAILENCIIAYGQVQEAIGSRAYLSCCNVYGNAEGDWYDFIADQFGTNGNISVDPLFCDTANLDLALSINSHCNSLHSECGYMGAFDLDCLPGLPYATNISYSDDIGNGYIATLIPEIHWTYYDTLPNMQAAFEIELGTDDDWSAAEMWSSGSVYSGDSSVIYGGLDLLDRTTYFLRLRVFNGNGWGDWNYSSFTTHTSNTIYIPSDFAEIQEGIDFAREEDTIVLADGVYTGEGNYNLNYYGKNLTVMSANGAQGCIIDCQGNGCGFIFENGETSAVLKGITIKNGVAIQDRALTGGGIAIQNSTPHIDSCIFINNTSEHQGGAVGIYDTEPEITNCLFIGNSAGYGAAIYVNSSNATFQNCTFYNNSSNINSGAIECDYCSPYITNCIIAYGAQGQAIWGRANLSCTNIFGNAGGDWVGDIDNQFDDNNNLSTDPIFCDTANLDLSLSIFSPSNSVFSDCGYMGAYDIGCHPDLPLALKINYGNGYGSNIINTPAPEFFWTYYDTAITSQTAYEIEVGLDEDWSSAEMWTSGQVFSTDTSAVYNGSDLSDNTIYYLRVRVFDGTYWGGWVPGYFITHNSNYVYVPAEFSTIQLAVDVAYDGDTVVVGDGIYTGEGNRDITLQGKSIVIMSEGGPEVTIIDCQATDTDPHRAFNILEDETSTSELIGFTIINGYSPLMLMYHEKLDGGALFIVRSSPIIRDCVFKDNRCGNHGGAITAYSSNPQVINCTIAGDSAQYGGAVYLDKSSGLFEYCTFYDNRASNMGSVFQCDASSPTLNHCILAFNRDTLAIYGGATMSCTNMYGNYCGDWPGNLISQLGQNGNISQDPMFCDTANLDLTLSAYSPCNYIYSACGSMGAGGIGCDFLLPFAINIDYSDKVGDNMILTTSPTIYWEYFDTAATSQSAYEIEIGTDEDWTSAEMWSSGQVNSSDTFTVYSGLSLADKTAYYLRIRVSDGSNWGGWTFSEFTTHLSGTASIPTDFATIQEGIDWTVAGDTVLIDEGIYSGDGNYNIDFQSKDITVVSTGNPANTIIDCQNNGCGFIIDGCDSGTVLKGLTIKNGVARVERAQTGGAVFVGNSSPLIDSCIFINNNSGHQGGALGCFASTPTITNCKFIYNQANYGAAIYLNGSPTSIQNCTMFKNLATGMGAGIHSDGCAPEINNCIIAFSSEAAQLAVVPRLVVLIYLEMRKEITPIILFLNLKLMGIFRLTRCFATPLH